MNFRKLWHLLTTSPYTRSLEQRVERLEAAVFNPTAVQSSEAKADSNKSVAPCCDGETNPKSGEFIHTTDCSSIPRPFRIKRSWRQEKIELERQHNQRAEKGKRLAQNLKELPPKLYQ